VFAIKQLRETQRKFDTLPPNLEVVEADNGRLRQGLEKIERLFVSEPKDLESASLKAIQICRSVLNINCHG
jgi:hypothetical protein